MLRGYVNRHLQKRVTTTIRGLRPWNSELGTHCNRSGTRVMKLASDLRTTTVDLAGKLPALDISVARQRLLCTCAHLTTLGRELAETKLELLRTGQFLRKSSSLNEQLINTMRLVGDRAAELLKEGDAAVQRHADLPSANEITRAELNARLDEILSRLEAAKQKERERERWHLQKHGQSDSGPGRSEAPERGLADMLFELLELVKEIIAWVGKRTASLYDRQQAEKLAKLMINAIVFCTLGDKPW